MLVTPLDPKPDIGRLKKGCAKDYWEMGVEGGNLGNIFTFSYLFSDQLSNATQESRPSRDDLKFPTDYRSNMAKFYIESTSNTLLENNVHSFYNLAHFYD